ncbi:DedA family protein [Cutibacterium sp. WCA-380-WT-3A]|uniref:DedA family protein n=1 Tax=Cutibacterium porci TaxID=2605781 RepID=A0A7K0J9Z1_9ACTN|nr:DedA family protein [Cutibacterium porci]MSS46633.1 DedA family protein [Cutibacterium porci]
MDMTAWMASINGVIAANASQPWVIGALWGLCVVDGFFPPVPSESLVVALAAIGHPPWWLIIPVAAVGAICGDNIAYWVGRRLGHTKLFTGGPKRQKTVAWARRQLQIRGPLCILVARYIPGGRVVVNAMAGATRFSYRVFLPVDVLAGALWAGYATAIGAGAASVLGNNHILAAAVGIIGAVIIGVILDQILQRLMPGSDVESARSYREP